MKKLDKEGMLRKYRTTFAELSGEKPLSPIVGMGMVSMQQVAGYLGVDTKEVQALRQRLRRDMDALGMVIATAREFVGSIPGAVRHSDGGYDLPLEDGGMTHVPGGKYTYFSAAAVKRLAEEIQSARQAGNTGMVLHTEFFGTETSNLNAVSGNIVLKVDFSRDNPAVSARELHEFLEVKSDFSHWFSRMCEYGFSEGQDFTSFLTETQTPCAGRPATDAAISIDMAKEICMLQRNEKGKQARQYFLQLERDWNSPEQVMARAIKLADKKIRRLEGKVEELEQTNENLSLSNAMLSKAERKWNPREVVDRLIRLYSSVVFGNDFRLGWADFHRELRYRMNINLKLRAGSSSLISRVKDEEWRDVIAVAAAMCQSNGIDPARAINQTNADIYLEDIYVGR